MRQSLNDFYKVSKEEYDTLPLEDYNAIKQYAYRFLVNYREGDLHSYTRNVLGYRGDELEFKLFASTVLFPFDRDFCEIYEQYGGEFERLCEDFPKDSTLLDKEKLLDRLFLKFPRCNLDILKMKAYEIEHFKLDKSIQQGILDAPIFKEKEENLEDSKKTR